MDKKTAKHYIHSVGVLPPNKHKSAIICRFKTDSNLLESVLSFPWSPIIWKNGQRKQDNFIEASYGVLDVDSGYRIEDFEDILRQENLSYVLATSKSHTEENHRFRVILPLEKKITDLQHYRYFMQGLVYKYGSDPACTDGARFFFPSPKIVAINRNGRKLEVEDVPEKVKKDFAEVKPIPEAALRKIPRWLKQAIASEDIPIGERNRTIFRWSCHLGRLDFGEREIESIVQKGRYEKKGLTTEEIRTTIQSALERCGRNYYQNARRDLEFKRC